MSERVGTTDEVNRQTMGFTLKIAAFLATVAAAAVMSFAGAPEATAATSIVSGRALDYSHPCRTYDPCLGVPGATVIVDKYVSGHGWVREGEFATDSAGGYPRLGLATGYWWSIRGYKWVRRSECVWDLYGDGSGAFWPKHDPYLISGGLDHLVELGLTYLRSHSSCSQAPPSSVGSAPSQDADLPPLDGSEPPDEGGPPPEGGPPDEGGPPFEGTPPTRDTCRHAQRRSKRLRRQVKRLRGRVKRGGGSAQRNLKKAKRRLRVAKRRAATACR